MRKWHAQVPRTSHPVLFWVYVLTVTAALAALWLLVVVPVTDGHSLLWRVMAFGATGMLASFLYEPSILDLTGWTITVMAMWWWGLVLLVGSPVVWALWHTFVSPYVEVNVK